MFPHNPKLHYQEKMMGPLSSNIIMYAVPCWKKSGKDKKLRLILKFSKYPSLRHRCAIINFVYQFFPDIKQKRFPHFRGAGTAVRTLTSRARVWFPDMASHVGWVCCQFSSLLRGFFSGSCAAGFFRSA